jgi:hypothetical protein
MTACPACFNASTTGTQNREYRALLKRLGVTHEEVLQAFQSDAKKVAE